MAQKRMFSKEITTSDNFVDMPMSSQLLYFHLGMEADDEGFIGNAKMLSRAYGANADDLHVLNAKGFLIIFDSGVTVVKDWHVNNKIRNDRLKKTIYQDEREKLEIGKNKCYFFSNTIKEIPITPANELVKKYDRLISPVVHENNKIDREINDFEQLWSIYPSKKGKKKAFTAYLKAINAGATNEEIRDGINNYKQFLNLNQTRGVKDGSTYFAANAWTDVFETENPRMAENIKKVETLPDWAKDDYQPPEETSTVDKAALQRQLDEFNKTSPVEL